MGVSFGCHTRVKSSASTSKPSEPFGRYYWNNKRSICGRPGRGGTCCVPGWPHIRFVAPASPHNAKQAGKPPRAHVWRSLRISVAKVGRGNNPSGLKVQWSRLQYSTITVTNTSRSKCNQKPSTPAAPLTLSAHAMFPSTHMRTGAPKPSPQRASPAWRLLGMSDPFTSASQIPGQYRSLQDLTSILDTPHAAALSFVWPPSLLSIDLKCGVLNSKASKFHLSGGFLFFL